MEQRFYIATKSIRFRRPVGKIYRQKSTGLTIRKIRAMKKLKHDHKRGLVVREKARFLTGWPAGEITVFGDKLKKSDKVMKSPSFLDCNREGLAGCLLSKIPFLLCALFLFNPGKADASPCRDSFSKNRPASPSNPPADEKEITPEKMGRDAIAGATAGAVMDTVTGEEISPASVVTDGAVGLGAGLVLRTVAPDTAREIDNFVDDVIDDFFGDW